MSRLKSLEVEFPDLVYILDLDNGREYDFLEFTPEKVRRKNVEELLYRELAELNVRELALPCSAYELLEYMKDHGEYDAVDPARFGNWVAEQLDDDLDGLDKRSENSYLAVISGRLHVDSVPLESEALDWLREAVERTALKRSDDTFGRLIHKIRRFRTKDADSLKLN